MLKKPEFQRRQIPLFILLGVVLAVWVFTLVDGFLMRRGLESETADEVASVVDGYSSEAGVETIQHVTASRDYVLFGPSSGSVRVFFKTPGENNTPIYSGIVVQFVHEDGHWVMTDSGVLDGDEILRARAAFGDPA